MDLPYFCFVSKLSHEGCVGHVVQLEPGGRDIDQLLQVVLELHVHGGELLLALDYGQPRPHPTITRRVLYTQTHSGENDSPHIGQKLQQFLLTLHGPSFESAYYFNNIN